MSALVAGFIPTSLQDIHIELNDDDVSIFHLTWFLDDLEKLYHLVQVTIHDDYPCAHFFSEPGNHTLSFIFSLKGYSDLIMQMSSALSAKLSTVEELFIFVNDNCTYRSLWDHNVPLPSFLQHFRSVKVLRVKHYDVLVGFPVYHSKCTCTSQCMAMPHSLSCASPKVNFWDM